VEQKWTLQDIFERGLESYLRTRRLPLHVHKAGHAIRRCRTAALGGHVKACPKGHVEKVFYNSCGHRSCPQCAYLKTEEWLERKAGQLLGCDHYHFTLTLPSQLYRMWRYDYPSFAALGFEAERDTFFTLLADPKFLGATPGLHVTLHTWNRALGFCPHYHVLVSGGGLGEDGTWKRARRKSLLPTEVIALVFKAKFRDGLRKLLRQGKVTLPPDMNESDADWQLEQALSQKWVVDRRKRYRDGRNVLTYFARYTRGGPLKNKRIESIEGDQVTYRKSRSYEPYEAITVSVEEMIGRILRHVPPPYLRTSRAYGLYAPNAGEKRQRCQMLIGRIPQTVDDPEVQAEIPRSEETQAEAETCPVCSRPLVIVAKMPRPRRPARDPKTRQRPPPARVTERGRAS